MILIIDDERRYMLPYKEELELSGYEVEYRKDVTVAFHFLEDNLSRIELLILDIMMPPGELFSNVDTSEGMRTGVNLFEKIREVYPKLPILILTNVVDPQVAEYFIKQPDCWFYRKENTTNDQLPEEIKRIHQEFSSQIVEGNKDL